MHASEIRQLNDTEIVTKFLDLKEELFNLRFQNATGSLEKSNLIGQVKKDIARVQTVINERGLNSNRDVDGEGRTSDSQRNNPKGDED